MKKATTEATDTAARIGTSNMAGLPRSPPRIPDRSEVGSTVPAEMTVDGMVFAASASRSDEGTADVHVGLVQVLPMLLPGSTDVEGCTNADAAVMTMAKTSTARRTREFRRIIFGESVVMLILQMCCPFLYPYLSRAEGDEYDQQEYSSRSTR
mmetsp:Transcript_15337/g.33361  ORF Transcript_15337/g.33361 Transcript_15337/m.33361 type:complete len:153 (+) Transcript_15337:310-768(+)